MHKKMIDFLVHMFFHLGEIYLQMLLRIFSSEPLTLSRIRPENGSLLGPNWGKPCLGFSEVQSPLSPWDDYLTILHHVFFPDFNPMNCSFFKIIIVNVKQMLRKSWVNKLRRQRCFSGPNYWPTPPPKFPDQVGLDVLFGGAARNRHMFGVSSGFVGIWRIWTLIGGFLASKRPNQNLPHVFCFTPFTTPPKKNERMFHEKGPFQNEKIVFLHHDFSESTSLYSLLAVFGAEISSPSLSESDKYSNSKPPAPGWLNSHQSKEGVPRTPLSAAVIEEFRRNFSPRKSDLAITQFGEGTSCR